MKELSERFTALGIFSEFVGEGQVDLTVKSRVQRGDVKL